MFIRDNHRVNKVDLLHSLTLIMLKEAHVYNFRKLLTQIGLSLIFMQPYLVFGDQELPPSTNVTEFQLVLTSTYQTTNKSDVKSEALYSIDLEVEHYFDDMGLFLWLEHSSEPEKNGVSTNVEDANSDAGTTSRRSQFSSFYLFGDIDKQGEYGWQLGLAEISTLIDNSDFANNEVTQFLSAGLVNNKTIVFPDYALSGRVQDLAAFKHFGYRFVLSSAAGMAENEGNYADLFSLDLGHKGIFGAIELVSDSDKHKANLGYWKNTADDVQGYGVYLSLDYFTNSGAINMRYGQADSLRSQAIPTGRENNSSIEGVSISEDPWAKQFFSLTFSTQVNSGTLAYGYSFTRSNTLSKAISQEWEIYYRLPIYQDIYVTPAIQHRNDTEHNSSGYWFPTLRLEVYL